MSRDDYDTWDRGYQCGQEDLFNGLTRRFTRPCEFVDDNLQEWWALWCLGHNLAVAGALRLAHLKGAWGWDDYDGSSED